MQKECKGFYDMNQKILTVRSRHTSDTNLKLNDTLKYKRGLPIIGSSLFLLSNYFHGKNFMKKQTKNMISTVLGKSINILLILTLFLQMAAPLIYANNPLQADTTKLSDSISVTEDGYAYKSTDVYTLKLKFANSSSQAFTGNIDITSKFPNGKSEKAKDMPNRIDASASLEYSLDIYCGTNTVITLAGKEVIFDAPLCSVTVGDKEKPVGKDGKPIADAAYTPITQESASTCENTIGWVEDPDKRDEYSTTYVIAKDPKVITFKEDIKNDPAKTLNVACASTSKQNYKDAATGKIEKIDTTIVINQKGNFANKAADFYIEFDKDPNLGWTFSKGQEYLKVTSVSFGGKKLKVNTPVIKGNTLTFTEVLAGIDLEYTVSSEGVSKNIIVKTKEALDSGIESIEFTLQDNKNSTFTKKSEKTNIRNKLAKNANTVQQIDKEVLDAEAKQTKDLEQKIKDKKISKEKADIEKKRISELPVANETIATSNDKYLLLTPETNIQTKDGYFTVKESFSLANNKLIIYPNIEEYKQNANIIYPIRIDPQTQAPTASKDTFTTSAYPTSARGSNNMKSLVVGGQAYIYTQVLDLLGLEILEHI